MNNLQAFGVLVLVAFSSSEPTKCYYCDNYESCNDPFDISQAEVMDCGNSARSELSPIAEFLKETDKLSVDNTLTCIKFSGIDPTAGEQGTFRSCYPSEIGASPVCDILKEALTTWSEVTCSTCDTDLCNGN